MATAHLPPTYSEKVQQSLREWVDGSKFLRIFIVGKTGAGKSSLVNELTGRSSAKVGESLKPETAEAKMHGFVVDNVKVQVWDTPGLEDGTEFEKAYLDHIAEHGINKDLYLFCIQMTNTRLVETNGEIVTMKIMTEKLGPYFWENTVIVLTFANEVVDYAECQVEEFSEKAIQEYFQAKLQEWKRKIRYYLKETVQLSDDLIKRIAIVPAGDKSMAKLPDPDGCTWMSKLFLECLFVINIKAQPALLKLNVKRLEQQIDKKDEIYMRQKLRDDIPLIFSKRAEHYGAEYDTSTAEYGKKLGEFLGESLTSLVLIKMALKNLIIELRDLHVN